VDQSQQGAIRAVGFQRDLDSAGTRWHGGAVAFPPPREDDAVRRIDSDEPAGRPAVPANVHAEHTARPRVDLRLHALPGQPPVPIREVRTHDFRMCLDAAFDDDDCGAHAVVPPGDPVRPASVPAALVVRAVCSMSAASASDASRSICPAHMLSR
jgi:hypothetical protein